MQTGGLTGREGEAEAEREIGGESARIGERMRRRRRGGEGGSPEVRRAAAPARVAGIGWRSIACVAVAVMPFRNFRVLF